MHLELDCFLGGKREGERRVEGERETWYKKKMIINLILLCYERKLES